MYFIKFQLQQNQWINPQNRFFVSFRSSDRRQSYLGPQKSRRGVISGPGALGPFFTPQPLNCVQLYRNKPPSLIFRMLHNCFGEYKDSFFLQRRSGAFSPSEKVVSPQSRLQEKKSLKTIKTIKSQRSRRTLDSQNPRCALNRASLQCLREDEKTTISGPQIQKELLPYQVQFKNYIQPKASIMNQERQRKRPERKLICPLPQPVQRLSFRFGYELGGMLRKSQSPEPIRVMEKPQIHETPQTPDIPSLRLQRFEKFPEPKFIESNPESLSITFHDFPDHFDPLDTIRETEKDWDLQSIQHVEKNLLLPSMALPETAKSTVSMLSERSECDSVVMGRLPFMGILTKLI